VLPWSLRSMADVRAARTEEKIGHSGRDDSIKKRETQEHSQEWLCHKSGMPALLAGFAEEFGGG
jgi:hypothetical protein